MNKYVNLLKTIKIALVCGATLLPLGDANAGRWNQLVNELQGTTSEDLKPLHTLCQQKDLSRDKWRHRVGKLKLQLEKPVDSLIALQWSLKEWDLNNKPPIVIFGQGSPYTSGRPSCPPPCAPLNPTSLTVNPPNPSLCAPVNQPCPLHINPLVHSMFF